MIRRRLGPRSRRPFPVTTTRAIATLVLALLTSACATAPTSSPFTSPSAAPAGPTGSLETQSPSGSLDPTAPSEAPSGPMTTVRVYYVLGDFTDNHGLVPVERLVPVEPGGAAEWMAIGALLAGPNAAELGATPAMYTLLPEGTRFLDLHVDDGVATINASAEFESGGGSASARGRLAQVVYTLTQFPHVTGVRFEIDGTPATTFSDAGIDLGAPVDRGTFTDQLPAVFMDQPAWGGTLPNPAQLQGLANVFEARFRFRILDAGGRSVADGPVQATCGTGCWGTFDVTVPYTIPASGPGRLRVWEPSAVDGSPTNLSEYPITLTP